MIRISVALLVVGFASTVSALDSFELLNINKETVELAPSDKFTVVCFLGTECPLAKLYAPRLNELAREFDSVRFVGINSNQQDSLDEVKAYAKNHELVFPMLKDFRNEVADKFAAERTPEVFVLDPEFKVRYRGRIDDQYTPGVSRPEPKRQELREAIEALLAAKTVAVPKTTPVGCFIGRVREAVTESDVTYCGDVAKVLQQHCVECHREDEIGPFRLDDYEEVVGWADTILEVIEDGRMPPWHADPKFGDFKNARHMPDDAKALLKKWVAAGMPYGDASQLPEPLPKTEGWRLEREPDQVVAMRNREYKVPADGTVEYQYFVVDPGFEEDKWISGAQIIPGNPRVVHHSIVYVRPPDGSNFRGIGWLTAYVPGTRIGSFPDGHAIKVPAKSKLVFQQHYTPTGTEQTDVTKLGLTFAEEKDVTHEVYTIVGIDQEFEIPPHQADHVVEGEVSYLPEHASIRSIMPHMHVRGKSFRLVAERDEQSETLLEVPNYDFNWQHSYQLKEPLPLTSIDRLKFSATFDNSDANPVNPDPSAHVTWGDQTWEEMAIGFLEVSEPRDPKLRPKKVKKTEEQKAADTVATAKRKAEQEKQVAAHVKRILDRFDTDEDGVIAEADCSIAFRRYVFGRIDRNPRDRKITRDEIEAEAWQHLK